MMTRQEIAQIITIMRRAPLTNMREAEAVAALIQRLASEAEALDQPVEQRAEQVADTKGK
jgi:hypothetical protein